MSVVLNVHDDLARLLQAEADSFSVEHFHPQAWAAAEVCDYDNLLYTCVRCNAAKRDLTAGLDRDWLPCGRPAAIRGPMESAPASTNDEASATCPNSSKGTRKGDRHHI